ncbi:MAG: hypothetical protein SGJ07_16295 [Rhodospirillaceae bacterium]|nr:hypothetical protein [Rhodospirillaceae bacterium]
MRFALPRRVMALAALPLALVASGALAEPEHIAGLWQECQTQLGYSAERCTCLADRLAYQFDDDQEAFMYAHAIENELEIRRLQSILSIGEMQATGNFMSGIDDICR